MKFKHSTHQNGDGGGVCRLVNVYVLCTSVFITKRFVLVRAQKH